MWRHILRFWANQFCQLNYGTQKIYERILMKFCTPVEHGRRKQWLYFGGNPDLFFGFWISHYWGLLTTRRQQLYCIKSSVKCHCTVDSVSERNSVLTWHAQVLGLRRFMTTLWTANWLPASVLEPFTTYVVFTVADLRIPDTDTSIGTTWYISYHCSY